MHHPVGTMLRAGITLLLGEGAILRARRRQGTMLRRVRVGTMLLLERVAGMGILRALVRMGRGRDNSRARRGSLRRMTFRHLARAREALQARWINIGRTCSGKWVFRMQCEITCLATNPNSTNGNNNRPMEA